MITARECSRDKNTKMCSEATLAAAKTSKRSLFPIIKSKSMTMLTAVVRADPKQSHSFARRSNGTISRTFALPESN